MAIVEGPSAASVHGSPRDDRHAEGRARARRSSSCRTRSASASSARSRPTDQARLRFAGRDGRQTVLRPALRCSNRSDMGLLRGTTLPARVERMPHGSGRSAGTILERSRYSRASALRSCARGRRDHASARGGELRAALRRFGGGGGMAAHRRQLRMWRLSDRRRMPGGDRPRAIPVAATRAAAIPAAWASRRPGGGGIMMLPPGGPYRAPGPRHRRRGRRR